MANCAEGRSVLGHHPFLHGRTACLCFCICAISFLQQCVAVLVPALSEKLTAIQPPYVNSASCRLSVGREAAEGSRRVPDGDGSAPCLAAVPPAQRRQQQQRLSISRRAPPPLPGDHPGPTGPVPIPSRSPVRLPSTRPVLSPHFWGLGRQQCIQLGLSRDSHKAPASAAVAGLSRGTVLDLVRQRVSSTLASVDTLSALVPLPSVPALAAAPSAAVSG